MLNSGEDILNLSSVSRSHIGMLILSVTMVTYPDLNFVTYLETESMLETITCRTLAALQGLTLTYKALG